MKQKLSAAVLLLLVLLPTAAPRPAHGATTACHVEVTEPRSGQQMGARVAVHATASLPEAHHLWIFARRKDFEPRWWPQGEISLDPETGSWRGYATLGEDRDVGWDFDIAVAVFAKEEHLQLQGYITKATQDNHWPSIEMPAVACPPTVVRVTKARK